LWVITKSYTSIFNIIIRNASPIKTKQFINVIKDYMELELSDLEKSELEFFLLSQIPLKTNYMVDISNKNNICFLKLLDNFNTSNLPLIYHCDVSGANELCFIILTEYQKTQIEKIVDRLNNEPTQPCL
jgi:hypothetical protein